MMDMSLRSYRILYDIECPITKHSNLTWIGFSEEGQLYTYDNEGVLRALNPTNNQWYPALDFAKTCPSSYSQIWIVGICDNEVMAIEMAKNYAVPHYN